MPKRNSSVLKSQRIDAIRQTLKRLGRARKSDIDSNVAMILGVSESDISRSLYRDLDELVNNNEFEISYFTRDGVEIPSYDPEIHKNTSAEWSLKGFTGFRGENLLSLGAYNLFVAPALKNDVVVEPIDKLVAKPGFVRLVMNIANKLISISIPEDAIPVIFFIARLAPDRGHEKDFDEILKYHGRRCMLLTIPNIQISSYKTAEVPGHASLTFREPGYVLVRDYNSSNGTHVGLYGEDATRYLKMFKGDAETITADVGSSSVVPRPPDSPVKMRNHLFIEMGRSFSIWVLREELY